MTLSLSSVEAQIEYDFDDGTLQGWEQVMPDPGTTFVFKSVTAPVPNRVEPQGGTHLIAPDPWGNRQDAGLKTLYIRSPEFILTSGDLTFYMAGGSASANLQTTDAEVLATEDTVDTDGTMFVGLRRVSDGVFVLQKRRGGNGNSWIAHSFTAAELAPFVGETCTLDLVDTKHGGWGWIALDTVSIPGVSGAAVVISESKFLTTASAGDTVGTLSTVGGMEGDSHTFAFVEGEGSTDNDKFVLDGDQLQLGAFDFSSAQDGTAYSVRLQSSGAPSGEEIESVLTLVVETPYEPRLVGFWNFNEGNADPGPGGVIDLAGDDGQHDGTMTGGVLSSDVPAALAGGGSRSLDLTGGNSHVVIDSFSGGANDDDFDAIKVPAMSVSVWVKGWPASNWVPFVAKNGEDSGWQIRRQGGNATGTFTLRGTSADDDPQTTVDIGPNPNWSHLVGTYDGAVRKFYLNGVEVLSIADSGAITPTVDLVVFGNRSTGGAVQTAYSNVQLDDIGIWNYALSLEEVEALAAGVSPVSPSSAPALDVNVVGGNLQFSWTPKAGKIYDIVSDDVLTESPVDWLVFGSASGLAASPHSEPMPADRKRFFLLVEKPAPPLFEENFDSAAGIPEGWVATDNTAGASGTVWEGGNPATGPGSGPLAANSPPYCVGTNITESYTADANCTLTTPAIPIPAGGATLRFQQFIDTDAVGDAGAIRLLNADDSDAEIVDGVFPITGIVGLGDLWTAESLELPASAANKNVKIRFEFFSDDDSDIWAGFYIDDVVVDQ